MYSITSVEISGFWGIKSIDSSLYSDVSIFVGKNGTGKTTLINCINACLTVNLDVLNNIDFGEIKVKLFKKSTKSHRTVKVFKDDKDLFYRFGNGPKQNVYYMSTYRRRMFRDGKVDYYLERRPNYRAIEEIKEQLSKLVRISWLSVHREVPASEVSKQDRVPRKPLNSVDHKLKDLCNRLKKYYFDVQQEELKLNMSMQNQTLSLLLYDDSIDYFHDLRAISTEKVKDAFERTFRRLNCLDRRMKNRIQEHLDQANKSMDIYLNTDRTPNISGIVALSMFQSSMKIVEIADEYDEKRSKLFEPFNKIDKLLVKFLPKLKIKLASVTETDDMKIVKGDIELTIEQLSSGEKQLLIQFLEALLEREQAYLYIADEPELSLHINWQRNLISALCELNPNIQIIVATHSPEIAAHWRENLIHMERVLV